MATTYFLRKKNQRGQKNLAERRYMGKKGNKKGGKMGKNGAEKMNYHSLL